MVFTPAKGSEEERRAWKQWASNSGLTHDNGEFRNTIIPERRRVFRCNLQPQDANLLGSIESAMINVFHFRNSVTERWPETIRVMLNDASISGEETRPFESWVGPPGLEKRKQGTRVWTELVQFFVLEYHVNNITWSNDSTSLTLRGEQGYLPEMGISVSEDLGDDIMDICQLTLFGIEGLKDAVLNFCLSVIMQANPTPQNNPLLFWVHRLLQTEEFGDQPRLEFGSLKDELTTREKLEALVHYARVLIMDHACMSWVRSDCVSQELKTPVQDALNPGNMAWSDRGEPRPVEKKGDPADFSQPHWQSIKAHFDTLRKKWLVKGSNSPIGVILMLL
jgi:hypothetical protein